MTNNLQNHDLNAALAWSADFKRVYGSLKKWQLVVFEDTEESKITRWESGKTLDECERLMNNWPNATSFVFDISFVP